MIAPTRGDTITALLSSDDFDALLLLTDWSGRPLAENDDAGGDCNARLTYVIRRNGLYRLYATSSSGSELGAFRLEYRLGAVLPPPSAPDTVCAGFGPVAGTVALGETVMGGLERDDPMLEDSTHFERWTLSVPAATMFTVDVESQEFDPYVLLALGRGETLGADDDSGPGCWARLTHVTWDARPLRIIVSSSNVPPRQTGSYFLRVRTGGLPGDSATDCRLGVVGPGRERPARAIEIGQRVAGELTTGDQLLPRDSTYAQWWTVRGARSDSVTIDLVSEAFDAYLIVTGPGLGTPLEDDDAGGRCHARITLVFPRSAEYEIIVNTTEPLATGPFVLSIVTGTPAAVSGRCERGGRDGG